MSTLQRPAAISLKNILFVTDLAPSSEMAFRYACAFVRESGVRVHTLHVSVPDNYQLLNPEAFTATFGRKHESPRHGLDVLKGLLEGLPGEIPVRGLRVWEVIAGVAARNEIDLLILGTPARTGLPKLVFGSMAEEVFRDVAIPVLTVGSDVKPPSSSRLMVERVLLATDGSSSSCAPACAVEWCERFGAELIVIHVAGQDRPPAPGSPARASRDGVVAPGSPARASRDGVVGPGSAARQVKEMLAGIAPRIMELPRRPVFLVEYGDPVARVLHAAMELNADLVIMGAHHPQDVCPAPGSPWGCGVPSAHFAPWGGNTAAGVITGAPCPVLTVRDREPAAGVLQHSEQKAG